MADSQIEEEKIDLKQLQLTNNTLFKRMVNDPNDESNEKTKGST